MKFCPHCGQPLGDVGLFCASCGAKVREATTPTDDTRPRPDAAEAPAEQTMVRGTAPTGATTSSDDTVARPTSPYGGNDWSAASAPSLGEMAAPAAPVMVSGGIPSGPVTPAAAGTTKVDLASLLRGNWLGAGITALVAVLLAFLASGALILVADPPEMTVDDKLTAAASATAAIATVDVVGGYELSEEDAERYGLGSAREAQAAAGVVPLSIALLAFGTAAWVFRRLTRSYPGFRYAVGDAARTGVVFGLLLLVVALVFRGDNRDAANNFTYVAEESSFGYGANAVSALFLGFLVMFVVLVAACFLRRDWLGPRARRVHDFLSAPLAGLGTFIALLPVAGVVGIAAFWLTAKDIDQVNAEVDLGDRIALWISSVGNVGLGFIGLGGGGRLGGSYSAEGTFPDYDEEDFVEKDAEFRRLSWIVDQTDAGGLWLAIPCLFLVLAVAAWVVIGRSRRTEGSPMMNMLVWFGVMFVSLPLLGRVLSGHGSYTQESRQGSDTWRVEAEGFAGLKPSDTLLLALIAVLVGLVIAALRGAIDVRGIAATLQQAPGGATPQPPPASPHTAGGGDPSPYGSNAPTGPGGASFGSQPAGPPATTQHPDAPTTGPWGGPPSSP